MSEKRKAVRRPDLVPYFAARIDWHRRGMMATSRASLPPGVTIRGDVTDTLIVATDRDGNEFRWTGGRYSARKVDGCYPPLMPRPVLERTTR